MFTHRSDAGSAVICMSMGALGLGPLTACEGGGDSGTDVFFFSFLQLLVVAAGTNHSAKKERLVCVTAGERGAAVGFGEPPGLHLPGRVLMKGSAWFVTDFTLGGEGWRSGFCCSMKCFSLKFS